MRPTRTKTPPRGRAMVLAPTALLALWMLFTLGVLIAVPGAALAAPRAWVPLPAPWTASATVNDIAAFSPGGLAAAGAGGRAALSLNGGATWANRSPAAQNVTATLRGIAFRDAAQGVVVGDGGTLLVTSNGGRSWRTTAFIGMPPAVDLHGVALRGDAGYAVGDGGTLLRTDDAGETWRALASPTPADLLAVALAADGTVIMGGAGGVVVSGTLGDLTVASVGTDDVVAVAVGPARSPGDGTPDFVAGTGAAVFGSDDGVAFTLLLGEPVYGPGGDLVPWPALAWPGIPAGTLLVGTSAGSAGFFAPAAESWRQTLTGLPELKDAAAPGAESVAYVLAPDGRTARTLSAGRAPASAQLARGTVTYGSAARLTATVNVGASGVVLLQRRTVGASSWTRARSIPWTASGYEQVLSLDLKPKYSSDYRLRFLYGGATADLTDNLRVRVRPRVTPARTRYTLRVGDAYRFRGTVSPALPGERVILFTDRGGKWRRLDGGSAVQLRKGRTWSSRLLGAPKAERYRLRARIAGTKRHTEAWSPIVTVVVRR